MWDKASLGHIATPGIALRIKLTYSCEANWSKAYDANYHHTTTKRIITMGKLVEIKTKQTTSSVEDFIANVPDDQKRKDSLTLMKLMEKVSKEPPKMWGASMIGFGNLRYKSPATGREVDWFKIGFSPRKANLSLHLCLDIQSLAPSLEKLGKHKTGVGCLYINKLDDIDLKVLEGMIRQAMEKK